MTYTGDPKTWPDEAFPLWNGIRARSYASGGTQRQHLAHVARLAARRQTAVVGTPTPLPSSSSAPATAAATSPTYGNGAAPSQSVSLFGATNTAPAEYLEMSTELYNNGLTGAATAPSGNPRSWPDSAFPVFGGIVARSRAAGGTAAQHAAHIARLEDAARRGIKTDAVAPSLRGMLSGGGGDTQKKIIIAAAVVGGVVVIYYLTRPTQKTGLAGLLQRGRKKIGI